MFELVSQRQIKDFGNISASNKEDGSLITSCDLWSDKTIVDGLSSIAPNEGVLSEEEESQFPIQKHIGWSIHLMEQQILLQGFHTFDISSKICRWQTSILFFNNPYIEKVCIY